MLNAHREKSLHYTLRIFGDKQIILNDENSFGREMNHLKYIIIFESHTPSI